MLEPLETIDYKGYTIKIYSCEDPPNPRVEWDNLGTMVAFHNRYTLGDYEKKLSRAFTVESLQRFVEREDVIALPLYLYDHGGRGGGIAPP